MRASRDADPGHARYVKLRPPRFRGYERRSQYLEMRDGTRIAVDVCLPRGLGGERVPTLLRQTRYFRRFRVHPALRPLLGEVTLDPMNGPMRRLFTTRGYAWVDVDVRGSGASFGERPCPWWLDGEVADGADIADWIVRQPWSSGLVGSTGVSYEGTTAEFLGITGHPAVRAVAPRFSLFDVYADVGFPGGLHSAYFTHAWETANAALDRNHPGEMIALIYMLQMHGAIDPRWARRLDRAALRRGLGRVLDWGLGGVAGTDDDADGSRLTAALRSHAENYYVHDGATEVTFRDDVPRDAPIAGKSGDYFSPHAYVERLRDVAVLSYGGWFDGAYANAAVKRHAALSRLGADSRMLIGPWIHGGQLDLDPEAPGRKAVFDHAAELLRFFDCHLQPDGAAERKAPRVRYYLMGEGRWCDAPEWPPPGTRTSSFGLAAGYTLVLDGDGSGQDSATMSLDVGAGQRTRWRTLLCPFLVADGRGRSSQGYLVYESEPLPRPLVVAGNPVLVLRLTCNAPETAIVAYLQVVDGAGRAHLVSEGQLRTLHGTRLVEVANRPPSVEATFLRGDARTLTAGEAATHHVELLPLALRVRAGSRLRLSLGAADVDHFTTPSGPRPLTWTIERGQSRLLLPVV